MDSTWTPDWPSEPGLYLFYGDYGKPGRPSFKPRLKLCRAEWVGGSDTGVRSLMLIADGAFLYRAEQSGLFRRFEAEPPPWPSGLSAEDRGAIMDMLQWRASCTDLLSQELELLLTNYFYTASLGDVPLGHQPALQGHSNVEQAALIHQYCLDHDTSRKP